MNFVETHTHTHAWGETVGKLRREDRNTVRLKRRQKGEGAEKKKRLSEKSQKCKRDTGVPKHL